MAKLPVTVTSVVLKKEGLYAVSIAMADMTTQVFLIPPTLASVEAVTVSALAMAMLNDIATAGPTGHGPGHRRYDPRP